MESTTEGVSAYSPRQIGANLSSIASSSHSSSNDRNLSEPGAAVSSESTSEIQKVHSAVHYLDLARTSHPCMRAMAGSDQPISSSPQSFRSSSSGTQSVIRFPEETETSEQSMSVHGGRRLQTATKTSNALRSRRRNAAKKRITSLSKSYTSSSISAAPSYTRSTVSSRAHSSEKKSSSHHSKSSISSRCSKSLASSHARSTDKKSSSDYLLSRSRSPYHERPSRRERSSRQSIDATKRIEREKEEAKALKEKEETVLVFNVRKRVLVNLLQSLYLQPDDTMIALRLKKDQLRTLSEHEASKERRRQRRQRE